AQVLYRGPRSPSRAAGRRTKRAWRVGGSSRGGSGYRADLLQSREIGRRRRDLRLGHEDPRLFLARWIDDSAEDDAVLDIGEPELDFVASLGTDRVIQRHVDEQASVVGDVTHGVGFLFRAAERDHAGRSRHRALGGNGGG